MQEPGTHSNVSPERMARFQKEAARIERQLGPYLSKEVARETAAKILNLAIEVDQEIDRILADPRVIERYEYDGLFFTPRGTQLFHRAFDGIHVLQSLDDSKIETFFRGRENNVALRWMMEELSTHIWEAKIRRIHWEEDRNLNTVSKEVIQAIVADIRERRRKAQERQSRPLSPEQAAFFRPYEEEMRKPSSKP